MQKLLCFDLDGTLTPHSTWREFNTRLGISAEDDKRLFSEFLDGKITYNEWLGALMAIYKKNGLVKRSDIVELANSLALSPGAEEAIAVGKQKGYQIVIVSGGVDVMANTIAKRLGVEHCLTVNKALFDEQDQLIGMADASGERIAKLELLSTFCSENGFELSETIAIGDGGNDLEIFKHTKGILLGHNAELAPVAWKQINSLSELEALL